MLRAQRMAARLAAGLALVLLARAPARATEVKTAEMGWTYSIHQPDHLEKSAGAPVIVGFHDSSSNHGDFIKILEGMDFLKNCYLVCPNAPRSQAWDYQQDVKLAGDFIEEIQKNYKPTRTIVFGFSRGAAFSVPLCLGFPLMQGCILCSSAPCETRNKAGGSAQVAYYVIHGTSDTIFLPSEGKKVWKLLEQSSIQLLHYEEVFGMGHEINVDQVKAGFAWLDKVLGPAILVLSETEASDRMKALEKAVKDKDWEAVKAGLPQLSGVPKKMNAKLTSLVKTIFACGDEGVAAAGVEFAWHLGKDGLELLKTIPLTNETLAPLAAAAIGRTELPQAIDVLKGYMTAKSDVVACAGVQALGELKSDAAIAALVNGMVFVEEKKLGGDRNAKAMAILKVLCEEDYTTVKEWKDWLAKHQKK